jgi:hypothetical protein
MKPTQPFNIWPLNIDDLIRREGLLEVKSHLIWEPSTTNLHPDGLFSEGIFGQVGSPERIYRMGFISLNTKIMVPNVYKNVIDLKPIYSDIMEGKAYATFNKKTGEFDPCPKDQPGCDTGYSFFLSHFDELKFTPTNSHTRSMKIAAVEKSKTMNAAIAERIPVLPAGIRDLKMEGDRVATEEINKVYSAILSLASEVYHKFNDPILDKIYDGVKYNIQLKVYELFATHKEFLSGKTGFAQRKYARRALACGTRGVISGADMKGKNIEDPSYQKHDETIGPLFQLAKAFQPLVVHQLRELFYSQIFTQVSNRVIGIDTKTYETTYIEVSNAEVTRALSAEGMEDIISMFRNVHMRERPVIIRDIKDKFYYLFLVYDRESGKDSAQNEIYLLRNMNDFVTFMKDNHGHEVDKSKIRPLTYTEMLYLATYRATVDKYCTFTRYPAIELGSIYPTKIKVGSTIPNRQVMFKSQYDDKAILLPAYPILGKMYLDSVVVHPSQVVGLGADYDGDTGSLNSVMSAEAIEECRTYLKSLKSFISPDGKFIKSAETALTELTFFNLTRDARA